MKNNYDVCIIGGEEYDETDTVDFGNGPMAIDIYYLYTNTLNFNRNTSCIVNNNISQRVGNTNHSWVTNPKFNNILKSIK